MVEVVTIDGLKSDSQYWKHVDWKKAEAIVNRLQIRIVKAIKAGDKNRVRSLQRLLAGSFAAKLKAVKRVVSNRGSSWKKKGRFDYGRTTTGSRDCRVFNDALLRA